MNFHRGFPKSNYAHPHRVRTHSGKSFSRTQYLHTRRRDLSHVVSGNYLDLAGKLSQTGNRKLADGGLRIGGYAPGLTPRRRVFPDVRRKRKTPPNNCGKTVGGRWRHVEPKLYAISAASAERKYDAKKNCTGFMRITLSTVKYTKHSRIEMFPTRNHLSEIL